MKLIILLTLLLGANVSFATTTNTTPENAKMSIYETINKAGYQRMLTQRIAKSYMAIVCNVDNQKHEEHLLQPLDMQMLLMVLVIKLYDMV